MKKYLIYSLSILCILMFSLSIVNADNNVLDAYNITQYIEKSEPESFDYDKIEINKDTGIINDKINFENYFDSKFQDNNIENIIKDENYTIVDETNDEYIAASNFSTCRILVMKTLDNLEGAESGVSYNGSTVLIYKDIENTKKAYDILVEKYGENNVLLDIPLKKSAQGWGTSVMNIDKKINSISSPKSTIVAVIDSGINSSHSIFKNITISSKSKSFVSSSFTDSEGHGTATAGIIAENSPSNTSLLIIKIMNRRGEASFITCCQAIQYATECNVDVINMSFGAEIDSASYASSINSYLKAAANKNIISVASSGNENTNVDNFVPANSDYVISVGSIDDKFSKSSFSNYGSKLDFVAPGQAIKVANYANTSGYISESGTSFSAPYISACANILKSQDKTLNLTKTVDKLRSISKDLGTSGWDTYYGHGMPIFNVSEETKIKITPTLKLKNTTFEYTGKSIPIVESVTYNGIAYPYWGMYTNNNKTVGTKTATVNLLDNIYEGSATKTFDIIPAKPKISYRSFKNGKMVLRYSSLGATNYEVYFSTNNKIWSKFTTNKTEFTRSNLKGLYRYVKIKGYTIVNNKKYYSKDLNTYVLDNMSFTY